MFHFQSNFLKSANVLKPLYDRIVVQRAKAATQTSSGIYIPEKNVEKLSVATVIAVGPGATNNKGELIPTVVKAGDKVLLPSYGGASVKVADEVSILPYWVITFFYLIRSFILTTFFLHGLLFFIQCHIFRNT